MKFAVVTLFGLTSFLAAVLLFLVEPMIGKMVLPLFGGTPTVWNTCLVFFQVTLLLGYVVSSGVGASRGVEARRVSMTYLLALGALLAAGYLMQPIAPDPELRSLGSAAPAGDSALVLLGVLMGSATLPLVMVSMTAPLVQGWFALTGHPRARDPYFLYAASNAGSLLALLAYPSLVEPNLSLADQASVWRAGYLALALLLISCGSIARGLGRSGPAGMSAGAVAPALTPEKDGDTGGPRTRPSVGDWLRWLILVFIPSSWLMGVTAYLTTDLAAMPLLWVIPLAIYLLSFIVAFAGPASGPVRLAARALPILVMPLVLVLNAGFVHLFWIPLHLLAFFAGSVACHGALARRRPAARHLSAFYVTIALGGLLGGVFNALIAPLIFNRVVEYPLAVVLACLAAPGLGGETGPRTRREWLGELLLPAVVFVLTALLTTNQAGLADSALGVLGVMAAAGLGVFACTTAHRRPIRFALTAGAVLAAGGLSQGPSGRLLAIERNFFGVVRVTEDSAERVHRLFHGSTLHGQQSLDPALSREPSAYFARTGPIGQVFAALAAGLDQPGARVAVVGLGAGTLATYARPGQRWTFYEIDPAIERIARDTRYFTYLRDCRAEALDVVLGDARLRLREAPDRGYRLLVLDPFSSDSLPVHLVTREAIRLYRSKLANGGVLAFHLSNRYLDLGPVMGRQAEDAGWVCRIRSDTRLTPEESRAGKQPSIWAVMAATADDLRGLASDPRWRRPAPRPRSRAWTDGYSDLASHLRSMPRRFGRGPADPPTPGTTAEDRPE
jgi:hypothetical protein